jgi:hypothetical protein
LWRRLRGDKVSESSERIYDTALNEIINAPHDDHDVVDYEVAARGAAEAILRVVLEELPASYQGFEEEPELDDRNWALLDFRDRVIQWADEIEGG